MDAPGAWLNRDLDNIAWPFSNFSRQFLINRYFPVSPRYSPDLGVRPIPNFHETVETRTYSSFQCAKCKYCLFSEDPDPAIHYHRYCGNSSHIHTTLCPGFSGDPPCFPSLVHEMASGEKSFIKECLDSVYQRAVRPFQQCFHWPYCQWRNHGLRLSVPDQHHNHGKRES